MCNSRSSYYYMHGYSNSTGSLIRFRWGTQRALPLHSKARSFPVSAFACHRLGLLLKREMLSWSWICWGVDSKETLIWLRQPKPVVFTVWIQSRPPLVTARFYLILVQCVGGFCKQIKNKIYFSSLTPEKKYSAGEMTWGIYDELPKFICQY